MKTESLNKEDCASVRKWLTATSMMIEAKLRTPYSESELKTWDKIKKIAEATT